MPHPLLEAVTQLCLNLLICKMGVILGLLNWTVVMIEIMLFQCLARYRRSVNIICYIPGLSSNHLTCPSVWLRGFGGDLPLGSRQISKEVIGEMDSAG